MNFYRSEDPLSRLNTFLACVVCLASALPTGLFASGYPLCEFLRSVQGYSEFGSAVQRPAKVRQWRALTQLDGFDECTVAPAEDPSNGMSALAYECRALFADATAIEEVARSLMSGLRSCDFGTLQSSNDNEIPWFAMAPEGGMIFGITTMENRLIFGWQSELRDDLGDERYLAHSINFSVMVLLESAQ